PLSAAAERSKPSGLSVAKSSAQAADYQITDVQPAAPSPTIARSATPLIVRRSTGVPSTYRLRKLANRAENAKKAGGTDESERAVEASLHWLAKVQHRDGYWDADAHGAGQVKIDEEGVDRD